MARRCASSRLAGLADVVDPQVRLDSIRSAGEQAIPFTSGILIGIGETRDERIDSLLALRELHQQFGHLQEVIIQNFVPKPGTKF